MMIENPDIGLVIFTVSPKVDFFISKVAMNLGKVACCCTNYIGPDAIHSKSDSICGFRFYSLQNSAEKVRKLQQQNCATKVRKS